MNLSDHSKKKQNLDYYLHLVHIAMADGIISDSEKELLNRIGQKLAFSDAEIEAIIEKASKSDYIPPYELYERFEQVYEIVKMILADGVIDKNEMRLAGSFAAKSCFKESEIPDLLNLLINGIKQGNDEEELFKVYKRSKKG